MAIEVERIEAGVYRAIWTDNILTDDIIAKMALTRQMVGEFQDESYCLIIDLTDVGRIPMSVAALRQVAVSDARLSAFLVVRAPTVAQILAKMLGDLTPAHFELYDTLDQAIARARALYSGA